MTRVAEEDGMMIPVTLVSILENFVNQVKTKEKDGYNAVILGVDPLKKPTKTKKFKMLKEFRISEKEEYRVGEKVGADVLEGVEKITLSSLSKGRGFSGVIKRWGFSRGPETHGSHHHREPGSIGMCAKPGRVAKGKKMPGRYGGGKITIKNVPIIKLDKEKNILAIKGPVPGAPGNLVIIKTY